MSGPPRGGPLLLLLLLLLIIIIITMMMIIIIIIITCQVHLEAGRSVALTLRVHTRELGHVGDGLDDVVDDAVYAMRLGAAGACLSSSSSSSSSDAPRRGGRVP